MTRHDVRVNVASINRHFLSDAVRERNMRHLYLLHATIDNDVKRMDQNGLVKRATGLRTMVQFDEEADNNGIEGAEGKKERLDTPHGSRQWPLEHGDT